MADSSLIIDVKPGERLAMSGESVIEVLHKSGQLARLKVTAPRSVKIERQEAEKDKPEN